MAKTPISVSMPELKHILEKNLAADAPLNYAIKIMGHPGIGKSDAVRQTARKQNFLFMDTRLAFKENIDLGGFPVPDHQARRMIYFRPRFIPPETVPKGFDGVLWFLDEANRAHPTVIQTLFQIISEKICGEHKLPARTAIVLAGNLGEEDRTSVTEFDDSALDGRLAVFHLKPDAANWLAWAREEKIHPEVMRFISLNPDKLWDEANIHPNPRGWHQVSQALKLSYGLDTQKNLAAHLETEKDSTLEKMISSLVGRVACGEFILSVTSPRMLHTRDVLSGDPGKLTMARNGEISVEDILWALTGALDVLREKNMAVSGKLDKEDLGLLAHTLLFIGILRADIKVSFFYQLLRQCAIFSQIPKALDLLEDKTLARSLADSFGDILETP